MTPCDDPKKYSSGPPSALGRYSAESPTSLRQRPPKKCSHPPAFSLRATPRGKFGKPSETCPEKNVYARRPSASGLRLAKIPKTVRQRVPKNRSRPPAFGLRATPRGKPLQPSETCSEKTFSPYGLRPPGYTSRKAPPAFGYVSRKNIHACQPLAAGLCSAKSLSSAQKRASKKRSHLPAFGFESIPREKPGKRSETCPEKTFTPAGLRPPGHASQKVREAFGDVS